MQSSEVVRKYLFQYKLKIYKTDLKITLFFVGHGFMLVLKPTFLYCLICAIFFNRKQSCFCYF